MKCLSKVLISIVTIFVTSNIFANTVKCPTVTEVKNNTKFIRIETGLIPWWVSQTFSSHGYDWTVLMTLKDSRFDTEEEALKQGQVIFDSRVQLMEPQAEENNNGTICYYNYMEDDARDYMVLAITPPAVMSSFRK